MDVESGDESDDNNSRMLIDGVKNFMLERIGRRNFISTLEWSNRKVQSLMATGDLPKHLGDTDDALEQLKHLLLWMEINVAFLNVIIDLVLLDKNGKKIKNVGLAKHSQSKVFLGLKKHKRTIETWEIDEDSTEKLNVYGLNEEQWQVPVIEQLIVPKPGGGYNVLGYKCTHAIIQESAYNDEAGNDPDSYHCKRCLAWFGSKWRFCEHCCLKIDDLRKEIHDHQETDADAKDENEYTRYKTWYKRKVRGAKKYKT